jgi:signal transduction histidine kinase
MADDTAPKPLLLDAARRAERLAFFELGPEDAAVLRAFGSVAAAQVDRLIEDFYAHLLAFPELAAFLRAEPGRIERLKGLQRAYFFELVEGRFDERYFASRLRVGMAHEQLGVTPAWYIGAFSRYLRLALRLAFAEHDPSGALLPTVEALVKIVMLDVALAIDTYIYGGFVDRHVAAELERAARAAEEALAARARVERLKDDLTNMVVHDLKNPVHGIAMMVQLALRKGQDLPEAHREYLHQIDRTCREMMRLIQNLLEISKMEEGQMPVAREPLVLAEVADEVAREYGPVAAQAGRQMIVDVATTLPPALGDRLLLRRVLVNLVVNALRHSGSRDVRIEGAPGPGIAEVSLAIVDHGRGIPPEEQARVFEKFRSGRPRSRVEEPLGDTGLGLFFCKLALERMRGRIALESTPGSTTFRVTLPTA